MSQLYEWARGARFPAEAQAVGERIERIGQRHHGEVFPEHVVADAKSKASPLHCCFQWNDKKAAESFRLDQARLLLRSLTVVADERSPEPVRAFVAVRSRQTPDDSEEGSPRAYVSILDALDRPDLRDEILQTALHELRSWRAKYAQLQELARLFSAVDDQLELTEVVTK